MAIIKIFLFVVIFMCGSYFHWQQAKLNYPSKIILFIEGFIALSLGIWLLPLGVLDKMALGQQVLMILGAGLLGGFIFTFLFPQKIRSIMHDQD